MESKINDTSMSVFLLFTGGIKSDWPCVHYVRRCWSEAKSGVLLLCSGVYGPQSRLLPKDHHKVCKRSGWESLSSSGIDSKKDKIRLKMINASWWDEISYIIFAHVQNKTKQIKKYPHSEPKYNLCLLCFTIKLV